MALLSLGRVVLVAVLIAGSASQMSGQVDEYQVKAAFLYNFAKFVKWPAGAFARPTDPLVICVIGDSAVIRALGSTIAGKAIDGRNLVVRTIADVRQMGVCQILFVSGSEQQRVPAILAGCKTRSVLTVGELEGFAAQGGVINLKLEDGKVRFEINTMAANEQGLQISAKLLSLARIVKTKA
jgi:YfiR/HmsC-like